MRPGPANFGRILVEGFGRRVVGGKDGAEASVVPLPPGDAGDGEGGDVGAGWPVLEVVGQCGLFTLTT